MWFVFPQIAGLGMSPTSVLYAISSLDEAKAYLAHPVLGPRLADCARLVLAAEGRTARQIFGAVDAQKFCSSMTLFGRAQQGASVSRIASTRSSPGSPTRRRWRKLGDA